MKDFYTLIREQAQGSPRREVCGLLVLGAHGMPEVIPAVNEHPDPHGFQIAYKSYKLAMSQGPLIAYYHSHFDEPEQFSVEDMECVEDVLLPLFVYSLKTGRFNLHRPPSVIPPFTGRSFILGLNDCAQLIMDWGLANKKFKIPYFERPLEVLRSGVSDWSQRMTEAGLALVPRQSARSGDVLLMSVHAADNRINHAGVLLEQNVMLHQLLSTESAEVPYDADWRNRTIAVYRKV